MNSTILQIPISKSIRDQAASKAEKMGFSSLQEIVRLFLNKVATGEVNVTFEQTVTLSPKNDERYAQMIAEVKSGKVKTKSFSDVRSLMEHLNEE